MNKHLLVKCKNLEKTAKNNILIYEDIVDCINNNKTLAKCSCSIPNALEYFKNKGIIIVNKEKIDKINIDILLNQAIMDDITDENNITGENNIEDTNQDENDDSDDDENDNTINVSNAFSSYLSKIAQFGNKLLTAEEEIKYCTEAQQGNIESRNILITKNLRLVVHIAKNYAGVYSTFDIMDLVQYGNLGLIKAVDRFDCTKGYRFSTYATWWIRQAITRSICDEGRTIRMPVHAVVQCSYIKKAISQLIANNKDIHYTPTLDEIADYLTKNNMIASSSSKSISAERVKEYMIFDEFNIPVSTEVQVGEDNDSVLGDFIQDNTTNIENDVIKNECNNHLRKLLHEILNDKELDIINRRFGLDGSEPMTLEAIGRRYNVSRERIRQIEDKAKEKLSRNKKIKSLYI